MSLCYLQQHALFHDIINLKCLEYKSKYAERNALKHDKVKSYVDDVKTISGTLKK